MKTELVTFRATTDQVKKLQDIAQIEGLSVSSICSRLVDLVEVRPVMRTVAGLEMKSRKIISSELVHGP